jgi:methylmalonyl-CoA mutase N-terminal domain/subunit
MHDAQGTGMVFRRREKRSSCRSTQRDDEVEKRGGATKAIGASVPKLRIEETGARRQARVDRGDDGIADVNKFRLAGEAEIDTQEIDNTAVRESQVARLKRSAGMRDPAELRVGVVSPRGYSSATRLKRSP